MEVNTQRRAAGLKDKLPDIQKTLDTVQFLKTRKVYHTTGRYWLTVVDGGLLRQARNPSRLLSS